MNKILKTKLHVVFVIIFLNHIYGQSIYFTHSLNGNQIYKELSKNEKIFSIIGDSLVCQGTTVEYITSTNEIASWSNGTNSNSIQLTIQQDTEIRAVIKNEDGCEFEQTKIIKVLSLPDKPIINRTGDSLIVTNVTGNFEWYRNGQLFNVGLDYIRTSLEGNYTVKVINNDGCENESDVFLLTLTGDINKTSTQVYPNPASSIINIESNEKVFFAEIYNSNGQKKMLVSDIRIDISELHNGLYFIKIITNDSECVRKFIVSK